MKIANFAILAGVVAVSTATAVSAGQVSVSPPQVVIIPPRTGPTPVPPAPTPVVAPAPVSVDVPVTPNTPVAANGNSGAGGATEGGTGKIPGTVITPQAVESFSVATLNPVQAQQAFGMIDSILSNDNGALPPAMRSALQTQRTELQQRFGL
jgi:hypothetical protein